MSYASLIVADGAQLYWPMQETSGSPSDVVASTALTPTGSVTVGGGSAPMSAQSRSVSYAGGSCSFTFPVALQSAPAAFTWEAWFNLSNTTTFRGPLKFGFSGSEIYCRSGTNILRCDLYMSGGTTFTLDTPSITGLTSQWHYLAVTWDGSTLTIYLDGASQSSLATTGTLSAPVTGQVGESGNPWAGNIADAAYYTRALNAFEVANHWDARNGTAGAATTATLVPFEASWKYDHYLQTVSGPDETVGFARHAASYDDSAWVSDTAIIGWTTFDLDHETIRTNIPVQNEVWLRRTIGAVPEMQITIKADDYYWLYVNGNLVASGTASDTTAGNTIRGPFVVPTSYLNASGQNVIAYHVQDNLAVYGHGDRMMADVKIEIFGGWRVGSVALA